MKQFVFCCIAVVLVSLIIEIFCPAKIMKKPVYLALSLSVLFMFATGIRSVFFEDELKFQSFNFKLNEMSEIMLSTSVEKTKAQIISALNSSGVEVKDVELDYEITELKIEFIKVGVTILNAEDEAKSKEILSNILALEGEQVEIWVNS